MENILAVLAAAGRTCILPLIAQTARPPSGTGTPWTTHVVADMYLSGHEPVAGDDPGDGCVEIVTKPWSLSPNSAVGGSADVLFMHNVSHGCK